MIWIEIGPLAEDLKPGERVKIVDSQSAYYGQYGTVSRKGSTGGLWVKHDDGRTVYHPWGYERVKGGGEE